MRSSRRDAGMLRNRSRANASLPIRIVVSLMMGVGGVFVWVNKKAKQRLDMIEEQVAQRTAGVEVVIHGFLELPGERADLAGCGPLCLVKLGLGFFGFFFVSFFGTS